MFNYVYIIFMSVKYKYVEIRFSNFRIKSFSEITSCVDLN